MIAGKQYLPGQAASQVAKYFPNIGVRRNGVKFSIYGQGKNSLMTTNK